MEIAIKIVLLCCLAIALFGFLWIIRLNIMVDIRSKIFFRPNGLEVWLQLPSLDVMSGSFQWLSVWTVDQAIQKIKAQQ